MQAVGGSLIPVAENIPEQRDRPLRMKKLQVPFKPARYGFIRDVRLCLPCATRDLRAAKRRCRVSTYPASRELCRRAGPSGGPRAALPTVATSSLPERHNCVRLQPAWCPWVIAVPWPDARQSIGKQGKESFIRTVGGRAVGTVSFRREDGRTRGAGGSGHCAPLTEGCTPGSAPYPGRRTLP